MKFKDSDYNQVLQVTKYPDKLPVELYESLMSQAFYIGPCTQEVVVRLWIDSLKKSKRHISNLFQMTNLVSDEKLEASCTRALFYGFHSMRAVETIVMEQLYQLPLSYQTDIYGQRKLFDFS